MSKESFSKSDAARIQSHAALNPNSATAHSGFAARAQSSADKGTASSYSLMSQDVIMQPRDQGSYCHIIDSVLSGFFF
jgi:hypothetical protein